MAPPLQPTSLTAQANGGQVTLTWVSGGDGGEAITHWEYAVMRGSGAFGPWVQIPGSGPTTTMAVIDGQRRGQNTYKVRAVNADGDGVESATVEVFIMAVRGALTTSFAITATRPATFDAAGYQAITTGDWEEFDEVTNLDEFGREYEVVRVNNLADGATRKFKGSFDNGTINFEALFDETDDGQTLLETAGDSATATYYFRVEFPGGAGSPVFFFSGIVTMVKRRVGGPNDATMIRGTIELDHNPIVEGVQS